MIGRNTKLKFILNRMRAMPSYDVMDRMRGRLVTKVERERMRTVANLPQHNIAFFRLKTCINKTNTDWRLVSEAITDCI